MYVYVVYLGGYIQKTFSDVLTSPMMGRSPIRFRPRTGMTAAVYCGVKHKIRQHTKTISYNIKSEPVNVAIQVGENILHVYIFT